MRAFHSGYSVGRAWRTVTSAMRNSFGASECQICFCNCFGTSMESAHSTEEKGRPAENAGRPGRRPLPQIKRSVKRKQTISKIGNP